MKTSLSDFSRAPEGADKIITHQVLGDMYGKGDSAWIDGEWMDVSHMSRMITVKLSR